MMEAAFDYIAADYDDDFTNSKIGKAQRAQVFSRFAELELDSQTVLELNAGTGEDALRLLEMGHKVLVTDKSPNMIEICRGKIDAFSQSPSNDQVNLGRVLCLDMESDTWPKERFDLLWSNFGGLNCLNEVALEKSSKKMSDCMKDRSHLFLVIMPDKCVWELFYFLLKGKWKSAFRRWGGKRVEARLNESSSVSTWYYSPSHLARIFESDFSLVKTYPIGLFVPPSYLENKMTRFPLFFHVLALLDKLFSKVSFFSRFSDHALVILKKR